MIRLIRNEFTKLGFIKIIIPFVIFLIIILIEFYFNNVEYENLFELIPYVGIVLCILFSGIISSEIENGTFRYYLTKSSTRFKVLTSKLLTIYIYTFILYLFLFIVFSLIINSYNSNMFFKYLNYTVSTYTILSFTFLLSIIIKNTPINLGACIFFFIFSSLISEFFFKNSITIIEYTLLPYFDFNIFWDLDSIKSVNELYGINLNINYATFINIVHIVLFNFISYYTFIKKDIKN